MAKEFNFEFELSETSIEGLIKNLKNYEETLKASKEAVLKALSEYTKERIQMYISESTGNGSYVPTGELLDSVQISDIVNDMVRVFTDSEHAVFAEFGTGVTGSGGHPKSNELGWVYDSNNHGEKGWFYTAEDGKVYWTKGEKAHQFMYRAWSDLQDNYMDIVKKVLRERGLIK